MAKRLSVSAEHALSVLAHVGMANRLDKEVSGMAGFSEFYKKQMTAADRAIWSRFDELCRQAYRDLVRLMEQDKKSDGR
jgi:hypothetical protein